MEPTLKILLYLSSFTQNSVFKIRAVVVLFAVYFFLLSLFMFCITRRRICHGLCLICKRLREDGNKACPIYHHLAASLVTLLK